MKSWKKLLFSWYLSPFVLWIGLVLFYFVDKNLFVDKFYEFSLFLLLFWVLFTIYIIFKLIKLKKLRNNSFVFIYFLIFFMLFFTNFNSRIAPPPDMSAYMKIPVSEPSNSEPIQIAKNKMDMVYNGKNSFLIKVKNTAFKDLGQAKPVISCNVDDNYQTISMKTSTERMLINQTNKFDGVVNINEKENSFLKLGFMYPCKIYIYDGGLEVNSIKPKLFFVEIIQK